MHTMAAASYYLANCCPKPYLYDGISQLSAGHAAAEAGAGVAVAHVGNQLEGKLPRIQAALQHLQQQQHTVRTQTHLLHHHHASQSCRSLFNQTTHCP